MSLTPGMLSAVQDFSISMYNLFMHPHLQQTALSREDFSLSDYVEHSQLVQSPHHVLSQGLPNGWTALLEAVPLSVQDSWCH